MLATEATALLHGREAADAAAETARKTFEEGALAESLPTVRVPRAVLEAGLGVLTAFGPEYAKLVLSTSEARRQVKGGGLRVNDRPVTDERAVLRSSDLTPEGVIKLSFGRSATSCCAPPEYTRVSARSGPAAGASPRSRPARRSRPRTACAGTRARPPKAG